MAYLGITLAFVWQNSEQQHQSGQLVSGPKFELRNTKCPFNVSLSTVAITGRCGSC